MEIIRIFKQGVLADSGQTSELLRRDGSRPRLKVGREPYDTYNMEWDKR